MRHSPNARAADGHARRSRRHAACYRPVRRWPRHHEPESAGRLHPARRSKPHRRRGISRAQGGSARRSPGSGRSGAVRSWRNCGRHYIKGLPEPIQSQFLQTGSDVRSLILRILATAGQSKSGMRADDIILFLEESFAVFLQKQFTPGWRWDRPSLDRGLNELVQHKLVEADQNGLYHLTALGRLAGVAGTEVESVIRVVGALQSVAPAEITDPTLIATTQLTVELDAILFPINRKSTQKEPQAWFGELRSQGIPQDVLNSLERSVDEHHQPTLRAKKAAACLMWISGMQMAEIGRA